MRDTAGPAGLAITTLITPAGVPARSKTSAIASAVSGVSVAGLMMTVQPAARAGPTLRVTIAAGKFQGVMSSDGPTGSFVTMIVLSPDGAVRNSPPTRTVSSENQRRNSAA